MYKQKKRKLATRKIDEAKTLSHLSHAERRRMFYLGSRTKNKIAKKAFEQGRAKENERKCGYLAEKGKFLSG